MSILINKKTKVICQGITGTFHMDQAIAWKPTSESNQK